jgi:hypothetical protein
LGPTSGRAADDVRIVPPQRTPVAATIAVDAAPDRGGSGIPLPPLWGFALSRTAPPVRDSPLTWGFSAVRFSRLVAIADRCYQRCCQDRPDRGAAVDRRRGRRRADGLAGARGRAGQRAGRAPRWKSVGGATRSRCCCRRRNRHDSEPRTPPTAEPLWVLEHHRVTALRPAPSQFEHDAVTGSCARGRRVAG